MMIRFSIPTLVLSVIALGCGADGATPSASGGSGTGGSSGMGNGGTAGGGSAGTGGNGGGAAGTGGAAGMSTAGSGGAAGSGGGGAAGGTGGGPATTCTPATNVELATAIPEQFSQEVANKGEMLEISYPVYYYTDQTSGGTGDPTTHVLEKRDQPIDKPANIYLPYGYDDQGEYPVVVILHGITDSEETWIGSRSDPTRPHLVLDALIDAGVIRPLIVVFPNTCSSSNFANCGFDNQAGYYYFANELVNDLLPFLESNYAVAKDRSCRGLGGFSMGGMQTINLGLCESLEHFASFAAFAAAPSTYGSDDLAEYLTWENQQMVYPIHFFYNSVGASDGTAMASHAAAVDGLTDKSEYLTDENFAFHTVPGGHDYPQAMIGLYNFLRIAFPK